MTFPTLKQGLSLVLLNSDFIDGDALATGELTEETNLYNYMNKANGKLWVAQQNQRQRANKTTRRVGLGVLYFLTSQEQVEAVDSFLNSDNGSLKEQTALKQMRALGVVGQPHIGTYQERAGVFKGLAKKSNKGGGFGFA